MEWYIICMSGVSVSAWGNFTLSDASLSGEGLTRRSNVGSSTNLKGEPRVIDFWSSD